MSDDVDRPVRPKRALSPALAALLAPLPAPVREAGQIGQGRDTAAQEAVRRLARRAKAAGAKARSRGTRWLGCLGVGFVALGGDAPGALPDWGAFGSADSGATLICARADMMVSRLGVAFQETPAFVGRQDGSPLSVMLTINPATGTWTLLVADFATGMACPLAAGDAAQLMGPATDARQ